MKEIGKGLIDMIAIPESSIPESSINYEMDRFMKTIIPLGSRDVYEAIRTALECGHDGEWVANLVSTFMEDYNVKLDNIDINYIVFDALLQEARTDIERLTHIDILNDTLNTLEVYANYCCTSFDCPEETKQEFLDIVNKIPKDDRTDVINWLVEQIE